MTLFPCQVFISDRDCFLLLEENKKQKPKKKKKNLWKIFPSYHGSYIYMVVMRRREHSNEEVWMFKILSLYCCPDLLLGKHWLHLASDSDSHFALSSDTKDRFLKPLKQIALWEQGWFLSCESKANLFRTIVNGPQSSLASFVWFIDVLIRQFWPETDHPG